MMNRSLEIAVGEFARVTSGLADSQLETPWNWQDYEEGVRFAFFRTYESLRTLAVHVASARTAAGQPSTSAQRILGQYHAGYRDLQAVLLGAAPESLEQPPAQDEWSVRQALDHIILADKNFYFANYHALQDARMGGTEPSELNEANEAIWEAVWNTFWAGDRYREIRKEGSPADMRAYYDGLHWRILDELAGITEEELEMPAVYWEAQPYPLRFRLHRFDSHLRQHTIQIEKTLQAVGESPNEAHRLLRHIFNALAEVDAAQLGTLVGADACQAEAQALSERTQEILQALGA